MAKRRVDDATLRVVVRSRATKGSAFSTRDNEAYMALQAEWVAKLQAMTREEIFQAWPEYTYDIKA